jgi:hypothetical protein
LYFVTRKLSVSLLPAFSLLRRGRTWMRSSWLRTDIRDILRRWAIPIPPRQGTVGQPKTVGHGVCHDEDGAFLFGRCDARSGGYCCLLSAVSTTAVETSSLKPVDGQLLVQTRARITLRWCTVGKYYRDIRCDSLHGWSRQRMMPFFRIQCGKPLLALTIFCRQRNGQPGWSEVQWVRQISTWWR